MRTHMSGNNSKALSPSLFVFGSLVLALLSRFLPIGSAEESLRSKLSIATIRAQSSVRRIKMCSQQVAVLARDGTRRRIERRILALVYSHRALSAGPRRERAAQARCLAASRRAADNRRQLWRLIERAEPRRSRLITSQCVDSTQLNSARRCCSSV